jgi:hypothetical protein
MLPFALSAGAFGDLAQPPRSWQQGESKDRLRTPATAASGQVQRQRGDVRPDQSRLSICLSSPPLRSEIAQ